MEGQGRFVHRMPFGTEIREGGRVRFRVWAPEAEQMMLQLEGRTETLALNACADGWHELVTNEAAVGAQYRYVLPNGLAVPDPVSRFQPQDVNGPSLVVDPCAYAWNTTEWKGRPWEETVLYELHVGTFTPEGTFQAAIEKLDYLVALGVTAIEIMSIGDFPGRWNWGYDGVLLYAPDSTYGTPDDLKALVDAAHGCGLMVILDVVYNHFGPEGNYLPQYFPDIATDRYTTPWGKALNFDARHSEKTRGFIIHNALFWIEEYRMDGLRLDAVHAIVDSSSTHVLDELAQRVRTVAADRHVHLILESDDTMWVRLLRDHALNPLLSTAQWNHDCKQLAVLGLTSGRTKEQDWEDTALLGRALVDGFTSQPPKLMEGMVATGRPEHLPPGGFVSFLQTHDLVGNRIGGERITDFAGPAVIRGLAAVYLLAPQLPMLFMGEEWGASTPFPFFCDFSSDLEEAVRKGRLEQFTTPEQRADPAFMATVPDPFAESTFLAAKLRWEEVAEEAHAVRLDFYRRILAVRHHQIVPLLKDFPENVGEYRVRGPRSLEVWWTIAAGVLRVEANLCATESSAFAPVAGVVLWVEGMASDAGVLGAWSVRWTFLERVERN